MVHTIEKRAEKFLLNCKYCNITEQRAVSKEV